MTNPVLERIAKFLDAELAMREFVRRFHHHPNRLRVRKHGCLGLFRSQGTQVAKKTQGILIGYSVKRDGCVLMPWWDPRGAST